MDTGPTTKDGTNMIAMKKTTLVTTEDRVRRWRLVDADGQVVGRLASRLAMILMGKDKPTYTPHIDTGDFVVVLNCEKVAFTGTKWTNKVYRHHSGWIGGLKETSAERLRARHPDRILRLAVQRMLPKGKLGKKMLKKLNIYAGAEHPHAAQNPEPMNLK